MHLLSSTTDSYNATGFYVFCNNRRLVYYDLVLVVDNCVSSPQINGDILYEKVKQAHTQSYNFTSAIPLIGTPKFDLVNKFCFRLIRLSFVVNWVLKTLRFRVLVFLVAEMPNTSCVHCKPKLITSLNTLVIINGSAGLNYVLDSRLSSKSYTVCEREECIGSH